MNSEKKRGKAKKRMPMNRSQMMASVHSENTKPEILVRRFLFRSGFRFRLHRRDLPGTPDILIAKHNVAIFVNGCFWHQHGCKLTSRPKSNGDFWNDKFTGNIVRDIKTQYRLKLMGVRVAVVWECSLRNETLNKNTLGSIRDLTLERLIAFIGSDEEFIEL